MERFLQSPIRRYDSRHNPEPATPGLSLNFQEMLLRSPSPKALRSSIRNPLKHYIKSIDNTSSPPPPSITASSFYPQAKQSWQCGLSDTESNSTISATTASITTTPPPSNFLPDSASPTPPAHRRPSLSYNNVSPIAASSTPSELPELLDDFSDISSIADDQENIPPAHYCQPKTLFASRADPITKKRIVFRELALSEYYDADLEGVSFTKETKGEKKEYLTPIRVPSAGTNKSTPEAVESPFWHSVDENDELTFDSIF
ncbi:7005_t:CDS:2 [Paraglomus brasilianum]|uniref:7005_t:CDS:1 n=1 Tax=Paraglomus brasilianum TaxID=144538 RepID=A0A9N8VNX3_9GLOM|nr:7005_t:CDS:2 [Paraglomus brasilianum]